MAADEAILEAAGRGNVPATLRLYAWSPPCLSLGYAQPSADADLQQLSALRWQIVRRPTGGRAILHTDELTYAVIGPADEPRLTGGVVESYQRLSQALIQALHLIGIPAQAQEPSISPQTPNPICFETPSHYEITFQGKKLIGSAQARRKEGVLQHGSLPLSGDLARITQVLHFQVESGSSEADQRARAAERLLAHAATAEAILGFPVAWESAARAFASAFEQVLHLEFITAALTRGEIDRAEELVAKKYANRIWTERN